jgi:arsenate reductase-like glutaredoxin family protein
VDATKVRLGETEALALARQSDRVVAAKGKNVVTFDLKKQKPTDAELLALLLGPTGNLRAPTARIGKTLLIGFNEDTYAKYLT